jgi:hypothetical protein
MGSELGGSMANADYYREQAETCLHMSRICPDPVLAGRLDSLAAEFRRAAVEIDHDHDDAYPPYRQAYGHARKRA